MADSYIPQTNSRTPDLRTATRLPACLALLLVLTPTPANAAVWTVEADGSGDFPTIQQAILASTEGDVVDVGPGVYMERLNFTGRLITVRGRAGADSTIIDAYESGSVVTFESFENHQAVLEGFTLRNGLGTGLREGRTSMDPESDGSASPSLKETGHHPVDGSFSEQAGGYPAPEALPEDTGPRILGERAGNTRMLEQRAGGDRDRCGGGVLLIASSPTLRDLILERNRADYGGGLYGLQSSPRVENCTFVRNIAGTGAGACFRHQSAPVLENSTFTRNFAAVGGGLASHSSTPWVRGCRFQWNESGEGGAIDYRGASVPVTIEGCVFWENLSGEGSAVRAAGLELNLRSCTLVENGYEDLDPGAVLFMEAAGTVERCIFAWNRSIFDLSCQSSDVEYRCCDFWPGAGSIDACVPGADNLEENPGFCLPGKGLFTMHEDSPCLQEPPPQGCGLIGALPEDCPTPAPELSEAELAEPEPASLDHE